MLSFYGGQFKAARRPAAGAAACGVGRVDGRPGIYLTAYLNSP